jgi:hypothetical protein
MCCMVNEQSDEVQFFAPFSLDKQFSQLTHTCDPLCMHKLLRTFFCFEPASVPLFHGLIVL